MSLSLTQIKPLIGDKLSCTSYQTQPIAPPPC